MQQLPILLIGGTDPSGAGLQTDWQVTHHLQVQACSVVTAVTSQNAEGVLDQGILLYQQVKSQLKMLEGIAFSAIKIGMLGNEHVIKAIVSFIKKQAESTVIILDPVLESSSGGALMSHQGLNALLNELIPLVTLITPNNNELIALTHQAIKTNKEREIASQKLLALGAQSVLVKGGHFQADNTQSIDYFVSQSDAYYLKGQRWEDRQNVRGTGCAFASAIACSISKGYSLSDAIVFAKGLISYGIRNAKPDAGQLKLAFKQPYRHHPFALKDFPRLYKNRQALEQHLAFPAIDNNRLGIYPVVDSVEWLKKLIPLGIKTIQLRIKDKPPEAVEANLIEAIDYGKKHEVRLFINDYWQLAIKHNAYGIHLGQEDLDRLNNDDLATIAKAGCHLGVSTHCYTEVARAHAINPSYLALGPIFETTSKEMPWIPQGVTAVRNWVDFFADEYPLVAIGGINLERAQDLKQTGVGSVAMISMITQAEDYTKATRQLMALWDPV